MIYGTSRAGVAITDQRLAELMAMQFEESRQYIQHRIHRVLPPAPRKPDLPKPKKPRAKPKPSGIPSPAERRRRYLREKSAE